MTKTEYEINDIKLTKDGNNFQVFVESSFSVDPFGQAIPEIFLYPLTMLNKREQWEKNIENIMIKRALDAELEKDQTAEMGQESVEGMTQMEKIESRLERINMIKDQALGKKDITTKIKDKQALDKKAKGLLGEVRAEAQRG